MKRAVEVVQQKMEGPKEGAPAHALLWACALIAERVSAGELTVANNAQEEHCLDMLEALLKRCYPDTLEPMPTFAQWLAVRSTGALSKML